MAQNDAVKTHQCTFCAYSTTRKYDLKRHQNAKHKCEIAPNMHLCDNVIDQGADGIKYCDNVFPIDENGISNFQCFKCNKKYTTKRYLTKHEMNCKRVDSLTCPKCMVSFANRHNKSRHIKNNKCEARSIIHARKANTGNVTIQNAETIQNINTVNNHNYYINNFGSERMDCLTYEKIKKILESGANTIPLYIEKKHFDKNFPENNNIKYTFENKCKVFEDNIWKEKDLGLLSSSLMRENSEILLLYCDENEIKLSNDINDSDKYEHIKNKLIVIYNKSDNEKYNQILKKVKELIKNSKK